MIETAVLSIINIILSSYELYNLSEYLKYTAKSDKGWNQHRVSSGYQDEYGAEGQSSRYMVSSAYQD